MPNTSVWSPQPVQQVGCRPLTLGGLDSSNSPFSQIFPDGQYFHLKHRGVVQQSLTPHWGHRLRLQKDPKVSPVAEDTSLGGSLLPQVIPGVVLNDPL